MIPKRYWLVVGTFSLSMLLYVDRACISAAKETIRVDFDFSDAQMGWIMAAFTLGYALCQTPAGILADRFGPRRILTAVVCFWSLFTALTGAAWSYVSMLLARFLFGAGEAGAFPGCARAFYSWLPVSERGLAQGINFSGSRIGAAVALPLIAWMVEAVGWRPSFLILGGIGFLWAIFWYLWFRDDPTEHPRITEAEKDLILSQRQQASDDGAEAPRLNLATLTGSRNMWLAMGQYVCSNFTFYFALSWSYPYLQDEFGLSGFKAGIYAAVPLLFGALGNWVAGVLVDRIYRRGHWRLSRQLPAILGFLLAAVGLVGTQYVDAILGQLSPAGSGSQLVEPALLYAIFLSIAIFGADMTLSPSWAFCIDIGRRNAGAVSGTMNMAGNLGAFVSIVAFPYLRDWAESTTPFFLAAAGLNILAVFTWLLTRPERPIEEF